MPSGRAFIKHISLLALVVVVATMIVVSDTLHTQSEQVIALVESLIEQYPLLGAIVFMLLAAASAMLAFFSSAIIVPIGVYAWGSINCFLLLWIGWLLGGIVTYSIGFAFGRPVAAKLVGERRIANFEAQVGQRAKFIHVLLFQAALPSEVPGYVLGTARYSVWGYLTALALVELPYAIGTVYLGASFIERQAGRFVIVGVGAVLVSAGLYGLYRRILGHRRTAGP